MNSKIKHWLKTLESNYAYIYFGVLLITFIIVAFNRIGLIADGPLFFHQALINPFWDKARLFGIIILNLPMLLLLEMGFVNFSNFIIIQGFWFYFVPLALLVITYINTPKNHKNLFHIALCSYLLCMNFVGTFITTESFLLAGLYWVMLTIILFEDLNAISYQKLFFLLACSLVMTRLFEWAVAFAVILIGLLVYKIKNVKINIFQKLMFAIFVCILFYIFVDTVILTHFTVYLRRAIPNGLFPQRLSPNLIIIISSLTFVALAVTKRISFRVSKWLVLILGIVFVHNNTLYGFGFYRIVNFFIPLVFSLWLILHYYKKINIDFKFLKILNFILLIAFVVNIISMSIAWDSYLNKTYDRLKSEKKLIEADDKFGYPNRKMWLSMIIQKETGTIDNLLVLPNFVEAIRYFDTAQILPDFSEFGVVYSEKLFEKIERNRQGIDGLAINMRCLLLNLSQ